MNDISLSQPGWLKKSGIFLLFLLIEMMVFAIITFSPYLPKNTLLYFHAAYTATLLVLAILLRRSERWKPYWPVFYSLFVAGAAVLLSGLFADDLLRLFGFSVTTPEGIAVAKFSESILRVVAILVLMPLMGFDWRSMYLNKGRIGIWLPVGIAAFIVFPVFAYLTLLSQEGLLNKLLPLTPWILLFVLSNGFMEELLYRGLFLKRFEPFLGKGLSVLLTAVVFTLMHTQVTYAAQMLQFLVIAFTLSLVWGYLIQKTDSLWGAVLYHAAGDCLIIFAAYASM
ncbi:MAG: CPBP family intramembrane metalloprotease [Anaerolineales bacterium]|nr:CPBP family intramembrane metalloprotease [Anaerolineales bacterium]